MASFSGLENVTSQLAQTISDGDLVTVNLVDGVGTQGQKGGDVGALATSWRSGHLVLARGNRLSVHGLSDFEDAARAAFNDEASGRGSCQSPPTERPLDDLLSSKELKSEFEMASAITRLVISATHCCLAAECSDGSVLVARHVAHVERAGAGAFAQAQTVMGLRALAWAGNILLLGGSSAGAFQLFDWDGVAVPGGEFRGRNEGVIATAAAGIVVGAERRFAVGFSDGTCSVFRASPRKAIEEVQSGSLGGGIEAVAWLKAGTLAVVRRATHKSDRVSLQPHPFQAKRPFSLRKIVK